MPRFVEQALRAQPGQAPPEILARADDDMERLIKHHSIRTELRNGGKQGKYEQKDGRWSLAGAHAGAGEAAASEAPSDAETGGPASEAVTQTPSTEAATGDPAC